MQTAPRREGLLEVLGVLVAVAQVWLLQSGLSLLPWLT